MKETATVLEIRKSSVLLQFHEQEECHSCKSPFCKGNDKKFTAGNPEHLALQPGDIVSVYLNPGQTLSATFLVLIVPLLLFILFFFAAGRLLGIESELGRIGSGFAGIAVGFFISYLVSRRKASRSMPKILEVLKEFPSGCPDKD
jgi:positive regulator of sigma E activity